MKDIRSKYYATPDVSIHHYADSNINSINSSVIVPDTMNNTYFDRIKPWNSPTKCTKKLDKKQNSSKKTIKPKVKAINEASRDYQYNYSNQKDRGSDVKARNYTAVSNNRKNKASSPTKVSKMSPVKSKTQISQNKTMSTPIKTSQRTIEKKLESRLPSTINTYHQTQRKTPRTSDKP